MTFKVNDHVKRWDLLNRHWHYGTVESETADVVIINWLEGSLWCPFPKNMLSHELTIVSAEEWGNAVRSWEERFVILDVMES